MSFSIYLISLTILPRMSVYVMKYSNILHNQYYRAVMINITQFAKFDKSIPQNFYRISWSFSHIIVNRQCYCVNNFSFISQLITLRLNFNEACATSSSSSNRVQGHWKPLRKANQVPPKAKICLWKLLNDVIPSKLNLLKIINNPLCFFVGIVRNRLCIFCGDASLLEESGGYPILLWD